MLILTRNKNETIVIGNDIVVTVLSIKGGKVRIGIRAPKDVSVHREEIYRRINNLLPHLRHETKTVNDPIITDRVKP